MRSSSGRSSYSCSSWAIIVLALGLAGPSLESAAASTATPSQKPAPFTPCDAASEPPEVPGSASASSSGATLLQEQSWISKVIRSIAAQQSPPAPSTANPRSSLASYCRGARLLSDQNYQASIDAFRASLAGDGAPGWTKTWSHIQVGRIFDITGQRERALAEYRLAVQTGDDTGGAIELARELLEHPFEP